MSEKPRPLAALYDDLSRRLTGLEALLAILETQLGCPDPSLFGPAMASLSHAQATFAAETNTRLEDLEITVATIQQLLKPRKENAEPCQN